MKCKYDVFISYSRRDYVDENYNVIPRQGIQLSLSHLTSLPYQKPIGLSVHSVVNRLQQIDLRIDFSNEVLGLLDLRTQADQFALVF